MENHRYCVIMAGGVGSRFWPVSRSSHPKQFLDILGTGRSFIRQTYDRFAGIIPPENFYVVTNAAYKGLALEHLPELKEEQVLCEPLGRNTAPCVAYAAYKLRALDPDASMVVTPADHLVVNESAFSKIVGEGMAFAETQDALVTIGIHPSRPDTGYGYIQIDPSVQLDTLYKVKTFTEKPTLEVAKAFVESGEFFWNSGIFIWKADKIIREFEQYLPDMAQQFASIAELYNTSAEQGAINALYPQCQSISIDYGIMEKAAGVYVRCGEFGWSDIGTWGSLYTHAEHDASGNALHGEAILYDTANSVLHFPPGKIAVIQGLDDFIVVDSPDALLICPKSQEQGIRRMVEEVKLRKGPEYI